MTGPSGTLRDVILSVRAGRRDRRIILDVPSLDLAAGGMTALAGPSGSGKSTLLYSLAGLLVPDAGTIGWGDESLSSMDEGGRDRWRRERCGFVFQDFHLIDELSPLANVLAPAWFSRMSAGPLKQRALLLLDRFGVPTGARRVSFLSRGEQQRVALARTLLLEPVIIFADEPTASLDARSGVTVADALRALATDERRTIVIASHDRVILDRADTVVRLERGLIGAAPLREDAQ